MSPKVSIIILNWNGWKDTIECLESLYQIDYLNYDVIVIDNKSKNDSIEKIKEYSKGKIRISSKFFSYDSTNKPLNIIEYSYNKGSLLKDSTNDLKFNKNLILIKNQANDGFAEGNNIGIGYALENLNPNYILLLNNDTVVDNSFMNELVKVGETNKNIAALGSKICYYNERNKIWFMGGKFNWFKKPGYHHIGTNKIDKKEYNHVLDCDWVTGAAILIRANIKSIKLNNEFFFGCEDVNLCIWLKNQGYKIVCVQNSRIWHKIGKSRKKRYQNFLKELFIDFKTNLILLKKYKKCYIFYALLYIIQILSELIINTLKFIFYKLTSKM